MEPEVARKTAEAPLGSSINSVSAIRSEEDGSNSIDPKVTVLIEEARELDKASRDFLLSSDKVIALASTIAIGGLTLGLDKKQSAVLIALPFALLSVYIYMFQVYTERFSRSGHRRYLEERINELLDDPVLVNDVRVAPTRDNRPSVKLSGLLYLSALFATIPIAWHSVREFQSTFRWLPLAFTLAITFTLATWLQALLEMLSAADIAYASAKGERCTRYRWLVNQVRRSTGPTAHKLEDGS